MLSHQLTGNLSTCACNVLYCIYYNKTDGTLYSRYIVIFVTKCVTCIVFISAHKKLQLFTETFTVTFHV